MSAVATTITTTTETLQDVARRLAAPFIHKGFRPESSPTRWLHTYRAANGDIIFARFRLKHPTTGEKLIRPFYMNGSGWQLGEPKFTGKKPLYLLEWLGAVPGAPIIIVEGEKAADSLMDRGIPATTSGGADSADRADWTPCTDRDVIIWPDNDEAGAQYADAVERNLAGIAAGVTRLDAPALGLPPKGDAADWVPQHEERCEALLEKILALPRRPNPEQQLCAVLREVHDYLREFVAYPSEHASIAHTLWIAHAHVIDAFESTPRLAFLSPEPGSGKTRALELTETLVPRPVETINATPAYIFRKVSDPEGRPTLLWDEIDTLFGPKAKENEDVRGLLNAGHRRGATAGRCVVRGKTVETEELPAFCAVALAGLGALPDTILTRSIVVRMQRRAPSERVRPYRRRFNAPAGNALRDRLTAWGMASLAKLENAVPDMPPQIQDRDADVWESLFAIADAAGAEWPRLARVAAVALVADAKAGTPSLGVRLLADLRGIFKGEATMSTEKIISELVALDEAPWGDLRGKPLDSRRLAAYLRPYDVRSKTVRIGDATPKGYLREDLFDAWQRYLPQSSDGTATSATSATTQAIEAEAQCPGETEPEAELL